MKTTNLDKGNRETPQRNCSYKAKEKCTDQWEKLAVFVDEVSHTCKVYLIIKNNLSNDNVMMRKKKRKNENGEQKISYLCNK